MKGKANRAAKRKQTMHELNSIKRSQLLAKVFTLIELLITIALITILAGILLPSLNKAKAMAYETSCANNMRQVGVGGLMMYASDHNGWALSYYYTAKSWVEVLSNSSMGYLQWKYEVHTYAKGIFKCPSEKSPITIDVPAVNFGVNYHLSGSNVPWGHIVEAGLFKLDSIKDSSRIMYLTDCPVNKYCVAYNDIALNPILRHGNGANVFFVGGNMKRLKWQELLYQGAPWPYPYPWTGK